MVWSIIAKYGIKGVAKAAAKSGAKSGAKSAAKSAGKNIGKQVAKGAAKSATDGWFWKVLDYTDPFYWIGRGIKSIGGRGVARGVAKGAVFKRGIAKLGVLGVVGSSLSYVATTILPDMIVPALGAAIGTAGALYGAKKIKQISENKEKKKETEAQRVAQNVAELDEQTRRMILMRRGQMARAA